jgi:hypothetical protein
MKEPSTDPSSTAAPLFITYEFVKLIVTEVGDSEVSQQEPLV